jgi:hypothetical protein
LSSALIILHYLESIVVVIKKFRGDFRDYFATGDPCISISKKAENTKIDLNRVDFNVEGLSKIKNDGKNTKISEWYVKRAWEPEVRGDEYWGT